MVLLLYRAVQYGRTVQTNYQGVLSCLPYVDKLDEQLARYRDAARPVGSAHGERDGRRPARREVVGQRRPLGVRDGGEPGPCPLRGWRVELGPGED